MAVIQVVSSRWLSGTYMWRWQMRRGVSMGRAQRAVFGSRSEFQKTFVGARLGCCKQAAKRIRRTEPWTCGLSSDDRVPDSAQPSLNEICRSLQHCYFEVCIQNLGRPAGMALHDFVFAAVRAYMCGYTRDKLGLQLAYGESGMDEFKVEAAGFRLTASEEQHQSQWLDTIYVTMQLLKGVNNEASRSPATNDQQLLSTRVLVGQRYGEEQSYVKFDRGLATKGASGGVTTSKEAIAPQWVPISQLVLLTMKVVNESI